MTKDYFKRLNAVDFASWDLNCQHYVHRTSARHRLEKRFRRKARRLAKIILKKEIENDEN